MASLDGVDPPQSHTYTRGMSECICVRNTVFQVMGGSSIVGALRQQHPLLTTCTLVVSRSANFSAH